MDEDDNFLRGMAGGLLQGIMRLQQSRIEPSPQLMPLFAEPAEAEDLINRLVRLGLLRRKYPHAELLYANADDIIVTEAGRILALDGYEELRQRQTDPAVRIFKLRNSFMRYVYDMTSRGRVSVQAEEFASDNSGYLGSPFAAGEIVREISYLVEKGLLRLNAGRGAVLTSEGLDCLTDNAGDVAAHVREKRERADATHRTGPSQNIFHGPVFQAGLSGAQLAWGNRSADQDFTSVSKQSITKGYEDIAKTAVEAREHLADLDLPADEFEVAEAAADEILAEVVKANPDAARVNKAGKTLSQRFKDTDKTALLEMAARITGVISLMMELKYLD